MGLDVASDTPYADDASLKVMFPKGRARQPSEVSFLLDRLRNETITRTRVIFAPELREAMREAARPLRRLALARSGTLAAALLAAGPARAGGERRPVRPLRR